MNFFFNYCLDDYDHSEAVCFNTCENMYRSIFYNFLTCLIPYNYSMFGCVFQPLMNLKLSNNF